MTDHQVGKSFGTDGRTHRVFVYGTLKRGHGNHALLETSRFLGEAATLKTYWMITTGVFPIVLDAVPEGFAAPLAIAGEIYHVDDATLQELDRLEREGRSYDRKVTELHEAGRKVEAEDVKRGLRAEPAAQQRHRSDEDRSAESVSQQVRR